MQITVTSSVYNVVFVHPTQYNAGSLEMTTESNACCRVQIAFPLEFGTVGTIRGNFASSVVTVTLFTICNELMNNKITKKKLYY